jgi:hypothetical protein
VTGWAAEPAQSAPWTKPPAWLWRAHAEGHIADPDAEAVSAALQARRVAVAGEVAPTQPKAVVLGLPRGCRRASQSRLREKMFGLGRPRALDRNAKVRIMHWVAQAAQFPSR